MVLLWAYYLLSSALGLFLSAEAKVLRPSNHEQHETFLPPKVYKQSNLIRNIQLEKVYARETISLVIENVDGKEQYDYYLPFDSDVASRIGGFEAGDKDQLQDGLFNYEIISNETSRSVFSRPVVVLIEDPLISLQRFPLFPGTVSPTAQAEGTANTRHILLHVSYLQPKAQRDWADG